jgi:hypothetical protein
MDHANAEPAVPVSELPLDESSRRQTFTRVRKSVVGFAEATPTLPEGDDGLTRVTLAGSGVQVPGSSGLIVTARSVVEPWIRAVAEAKAQETSMPAALKVYVLCGPDCNDDLEGERFCALVDIEMILVHEVLDLAVVVANLPGTPLDASRHTLSFSETPCEEGDQIGACGFPLASALHRGLQPDTVPMVLGATFTQGIVSAVLPFADLPQEGRTYFEVDALIDPGSNGGPIFDLETGDLVGIATSGFNQFYKVIEPAQERDAETRVVPFPVELGRGVYIHHARDLIERLVLAPPIEGTLAASTAN